MTTLNYKLGMGQMLVEGGQSQANLARATRMIEQAAQQNCAVIVLPECLDLGWMDESAHTLAQPIPGLHSEVLAKAARIAGIYIAAGLVERDGEQLYNAAVLIAPDGTILLKHRKINELDIALNLYSIGQQLAVVPTPLGMTGVDICADNVPDSLEIGNTLAELGAEIVLSPCAWAVPPDHDNQKDPYGKLWQGAYSTLAKRHQLTIVGVSNVGRVRSGAWQGYKCIGCSLAVGPNGTIIVQGDYDERAESLIVIPIEISSSQASGQTGGRVSLYT